MNRLVRRVLEATEKGESKPPRWTPFERWMPAPLSAEAIEQMCRAFPDKPRAEIEALARERREQTEHYHNNLYQVVLDRPRGGLIHLSIRRIDQTPSRDWRDFQRIKNELVGPENEAVELYPAESRKVDTANQFHLWVLADPTQRWPIGFNERLLVTTDLEPLDTGDGARQPEQQRIIDLDAAHN
jgi:hypothetical protein